MAEYTCSVCSQKFDEEEKKLTQDENKCILHCEKIDINMSNKFWSEIKIRIEKMTRTAQSCKGIGMITAYQFDNVIFPLNNTEDTPFFTLNEDEKLNIFFNYCHFKIEINFKNLIKAKNIILNHCHFYENVDFKDQDFKNVFHFQKCTVYKNIKFQDMNFEKVTSFIGTTFMGKVDFIHTKFHDLALFNDCKIGKIEFDNTFFRNESNFLDLKSKDNKKIEVENIENRETARIIKDSFEKQNNIIEANKYYALEMKKREEELEVTKKENWFEWLIFKTHETSSNHSQNALLALFWICIVGVFASYFNFYTMQDKIGNYIHFHILPFLGTIALSFAIIGSKYIFKHLEKMYYYFVFVFFPLLYYYTTNDSWFTLFANTINPFSIMTKGESLNLGMLIFKVIIAYLMYQFVISIRQNTRRK